MEEQNEVSCCIRLIITSKFSSANVILIHSIFDSNPHPNSFGKLKGGGAATTNVYSMLSSQWPTAQGGHPIRSALQGRPAAGASQSRALQWQAGHLQTWSSLWGCSGPQRECTQILTRSQLFTTHYPVFSKAGVWFKDYIHPIKIKYCNNVW